MTVRRLGVLLAVTACWASATRAEPWLAPGDIRLRADIQLLADNGILRGPVTTWPISWPDIARDVLAASIEEQDEATAQALGRLQQQARVAMHLGSSGFSARVSAGHEPTPLRTFEATPREEAELSGAVSWLTDRAAMRLQATAVADPSDGKEFRPDGTYLGVNVGNFMISAGFIERWWGPGWEGSLILSTNARPIPSLTLERNYTDPFKTPLLSWMGPWRASIAVGEAEDGGVAVANVRFLAARINFKPQPWLEFGLARTAQWCGEDRTCGYQAFQDMLLGRDNRGESLAANDEPGNQMAGYDMRLRSPWKAVPVVLYTQWIGEDEAGGLPSKFLGQYGLETWGSTRSTIYRLHAEYSDTACNFSRNEPQFACAYRNSIYPQGYSFRGRNIGHAMDNDSRMFSLGGSFTRRDGDSINVLLRRVELNRDGGEHAISPVPAKVDNVELSYSRAFGPGSFNVGLGLDDRSGFAGDDDVVIRGHVSWQRGF